MWTARTVLRQAGREGLTSSGRGRGGGKLTQPGGAGTRPSPLQHSASSQAEGP